MTAIDLLRSTADDRSNPRRARRRDGWIMRGFAVLLAAALPVTACWLRASDDADQLPISYTLTDRLDGLNRPGSVAFETTTAGVSAVVIADTGNHCIRRWDRATNQQSVLAGFCGEPGDAADADPSLLRLNHPFAATFVRAASMGLLIADTGNRRLILVRGGAAQILNPSVAEGAVACTQPWWTDAVMDSDSETVYLTDAGCHRLWALTLTEPMTLTPLAGVGAAGFREHDATASKSLLDTPVGIGWYALSSGDRRLFFVEAGSRLLRLLLPENDRLTNRMGDPMRDPADAVVQDVSQKLPAPLVVLKRPYRVAVSPAGSMALVSDPPAGRVWRYSLLDGYARPVSFEGLDSASPALALDFDATGSQVVTSHRDGVRVWSPAWR